ncbi:hypothetical protein PC110_g11944 [Phytophthora cactorum]|uniref:Uncharacterized protein n=1 Tax=Phytophthora cactorum TaxID=29920 RepID=A0A329S716_9STRA|nr:hypothetical protein PC110_g11944 [Phytophthora cactorum]
MNSLLDIVEDVTKHIRIPLTAREYAEFQRRNLTSLEVFVFVDEVTTHMYDWLRWIVERNLLLCEVENQLTRQLVRLKPTSVGTLKTYMHRVADRVGNTIAKEMGECFGIMFDRWSSGTRHFVAVFVVYHGGSGQSEDEPAADFASEILRRAKKPRQPQRRAVDYILLLGVIPPTSNRCEQLFSEC